MFPRRRSSRRMQIRAWPQSIVPSGNPSSRSRYTKTPPGGVKSLSVSRLTALGDEGSRQAPLSLSFPSVTLPARRRRILLRSEEHTSELQSQSNLVCRLLLEKKKYHIALILRRLR